MEVPLAMTQALPKLHGILSILGEENLKFFENKV